MVLWAQFRMTSQLCEAKFDNGCDTASFSSFSPNYPIRGFSLTIRRRVKLATLQGEGWNSALEAGPILSRQCQPPPAHVQHTHLFSMAA